MKHRMIALALPLMILAGCVADQGDDEIVDAGIDGGLETQAIFQPHCVSCYTAYTDGRHYHSVCYGPQRTAYTDLRECIIDTPQCSMCPDAQWDPITLDQDCLDCLVVEGCITELMTCGF